MYIKALHRTSHLKPKETQKKKKKKAPEKNSLYFRKRNPAIFSPSPKNKKAHPDENLLYFKKRQLWKQIVVFCQKKAVLIFQATETPKKILVFQKTELSYISGKVYSEPLHI